MSNSFYITTTLPYVNADPHIGFALEIVAADVLARYQKSAGKDVFFNTGTDEHGQKIFQKAHAEGLDPQEYVDKLSQNFQALQSSLGLSKTLNFMRTTDPHHLLAAQEMWLRCQQNGDIYKDQQTIMYCVGCELEKQASELANGRCPLHPSQELEKRSEENYFFKFSKYGSDLIELYQSQENFVEPSSKLNEISAFVQGGLKDFSISRLRSKMPWGVPVPGDDEHVMYVWFDALTSYISALGWPDESEGSAFDRYWNAPERVQLAGKDNLRQQAAMWQAMLISAGLKPSTKILINGFISVSGQKMSKSLGNVISPDQMVSRYGTDATRYLLMKLGPFSTDMDVSWEKFDTTYEADLVKSIGNTCSRIAALAVGLNGQDIAASRTLPDVQVGNLNAVVSHQLSHYAIDKALESIWQRFAEIEDAISLQKPWLLNGEEKNQVMTEFVMQLQEVIEQLSYFMPQTSKALSKNFFSDSIHKLDPMFPRIK